MRRRNGAVVQAGLLLLGVLALAVGPAEVGGVSVAQACQEVSCFSGVVAACGSCLPAQADAVSGGQHPCKVGGACSEGGGARPRIAGSARPCSSRSHSGSHCMTCGSDTMLASQCLRQQPREPPGISCVNRLRGLSGTSQMGASCDAAELASCSSIEKRLGLRAAVCLLCRSLLASKLTRAPEGMAVVHAAGKPAQERCHRPVQGVAAIKLSSCVMSGS